MNGPTVEDAATALGISRQAVEKRAAKEGWKFEWETGSWGKRKRFDAASLPATVQKAWLEHAQTGCETEARRELPPSLIPYIEAPAWNKQIAEDRADLLDIIFNGGRRPEEALIIYESDHAHAELRARLGHVTLRTLYRWKAQQKEGLAGLLTGYGKKGSRKLTTAMKAEIQAMVWEKWPRSTARICEYLRLKFGQVPSYRTIHRYTLAYAEDHREALIHKFKLNEWRHNYMLALGDASAKAEYPNHLWEADTTPADIICKDGKRRKVIAIIDVFSRRVCCRLVAKEDAAAVAATLRKALLSWGLPDTLLMDNGKVYHQSKHVQRVCGELGIATPKLPVRAPECKPHIERFFRTLSEQLFSELPGYTGNCLLTRPDEIRLEIEAEELGEMIDAWVERIYHETIHSETGERPRERSHLPGQVLRRVDERELDLLLMKREKAKVAQGVIRYQHRVYYHPDLPNGEWVELAVDEVDAGHVYVYWRGKFCCEAADPAAAGMTPQEMAEARKEQRRAIKQREEAITTLLKPQPQGTRVRELLAAKGAMMPAPLPAKTETESLPVYRDTIDKLAEAARPVEREELDPTANERPRFKSEREKYEWLLRRRCLGLQLDEEWGDSAFMAEFEEGSLYDSLRGYFAGIEELLTRRRVNE